VFFFAECFLTLGKVFAECPKKSLFDTTDSLTSDAKGTFSGWRSNGEANEENFL
jgi:hypothetical protein